MPWKVCDFMSEKVKFVGRLLDGEKMTDLCKEFGISRKTGHKLAKRYELDGVLGLEDKPRLPFVRPNETPLYVKKLILELRQEHPTWGAPKIKARLERLYKDQKIPATSTIHQLLVKNDLILKKRRNPIYKATGTELSTPQSPNDLWCVDFKGQFRMGNKNYCYPLTVTDNYSRYILACEALQSVKENEIFEPFQWVFDQYGIPKKIRSDNGVPFSSTGLFGLSKLSVWWLRLGIEIERIKPGNPQQNGAHERMHRTLKETILKTPGINLLQQQEIFESFMTVYNNERPHQGIEMQCPADLYLPSTKTNPKQLEDLVYPTGYEEVRVSRCGSIRTKNQNRIFISEILGDQVLGIKEVEDDLFEVFFMKHTLGYFDSKSEKLKIAENPFLTKNQKIDQQSI